MAGGGGESLSDVDLMPARAAEPAALRSAVSSFQVRLRHPLTTQAGPP